MTPARILALCLVLVATAQLGLLCSTGSGPALPLEGLEHDVRVVTDRYGVPHVFAKTDLDLARVQGWLQARDRMWQLDVTRRQVDGSLAELLGAGYVGADIQARTIGLHRAAERSLAALPAHTVAVIQAFSDGVNAWLDEAEATAGLPPEYAAVELTTVERWQPVDTVKVGKGLAASLSLDIDAGRNAALQRFIDAGTQHGFDGRALWFEDVERVAPMDPAATVPDATGGVPFASSNVSRRVATKLASAGPGVRRNLLMAPLFSAAADRRFGVVGSNEWGVAAEHSATGHPLYANDPHLGLDNPATFYEMHLVVENDPVHGPLNVHGVSVPGAPLIVQGQNEKIAWGSTTNPMDVTDIFEDKLIGDTLNCPGTISLCIESDGQLHAVEIGEIPSYLENNPNDGVLDNLTPSQVPVSNLFIFTVPFRSDGPIVFVEDPTVLFTKQGETQALVVQYVGFHATQEIETFAVWARAHDLAEFRRGLDHFDFGSQNWGYADSDGNLAYFASGELPLRRDLEAGGDARCASPSFERDGSGPCNWVPDPGRSQGQTIPYAILPFDEMPQTVNPENGFWVNANNDPAGVSLDNDALNQRRTSNPQAIYYLSDGYAQGLRAGRITQLVRDHIAAGKKVSLDDMRRFQGNTQQRDAELMLPFLLTAWANAGSPGAPPELAALAADAELAEAAGRLAAWDYSTPTGIPEGWDAHDTDGVRGSYVPAYEADASVAATIYNVWRAKAIRQILDGTLAQYGLGTGSGQALTALHHLLSQTPFTGVGASGVDFFPGPVGLSAEERRDHALLAALRTTLDSLASSDFANAFGGSTDQDDYRWGRLHRITFDHVLDGVVGTNFSIPPSGGFQDLSPALPGLSRDGGYNVVNASGFSARAHRENEFRFGGGPVRRYVGAAGGSLDPASSVAGWNVVAGGRTANESNLTYTIQLPTWLTQDQHPMEMSEQAARAGALAVESFTPPAPAP